MIVKSYFASIMVAKIASECIQNVIQKNELFLFLKYFLTLQESLYFLNYPSIQKIFEFLNEIANSKKSDFFELPTN